MDDAGNLLTDKKVGWVVWITYKDGNRLDGTGYDFNENTGFKVRIKNSNEKIIVDFDPLNISLISGVAQTSGGSGGDSLQFFVATESHKITIIVRGLIPDHEAVFVIQGATVDRNQTTTTFQLDPLEGRIGM